MHTYAMYSGRRPKAAASTSRATAATRGSRCEHSGLAEAAARQDRRRDRADELEARLRADSDRRPGFGVALRRRRRLVEGGQLSASSHRTRRLLHQHQSLDRQRRRRFSSPTAASFARLDGGKNFVEVPWGGDNHDIWIDPKNPNHFGLTNDAGARLTTDHGRTFQSVVAAHRADVSRRGRQPDAVLGLRKSPGQRHDARAEHRARRRDGDAWHRGGSWPRRSRRRHGATPIRPPPDAAREEPTRPASTRRLRRAGRGGRGDTTRVAGGGRGAGARFRRC